MSSMNQSKSHRDSLEDLRREIDRLDQRLFALIAKRMAVVKQIGGLKQSQGLPVSDPVREALLKASLKEQVSGVLDPWHVEELASVLLRISRDLQTQSAKEPSP
ncbi:MAG: chorismate mutase [Fidelibacterota bacterium]|nr:MAG: chorismate mutase [Candidatus Neomarinimicrobiota bacterium]